MMDLLKELSLTLFRMGLFGYGHGCGGYQKAPLHKICYTYPTMMKLGTAISYLKKIQRIYKSRDAPLETSAFFYRKSVTFAISRNTDIDCILSLVPTATISSIAHLRRRR